MLEKQGIDLVSLSDVSVGNDINASAVAYHLLGGDASDWAVSGNHEPILSSMTKPNGGDALDALVHYGGLELCGFAGAILAARMGKVPVILDSYGACVAALALEKVQAGSTSHCIVSAPRHRMHLAVAESMGKSPIISEIAQYPVGVSAMMTLAPLRGFVDMGVV